MRNIGRIRRIVNQKSIPYEFPEVQVEYSQLLSCSWSDKKFQVFKVMNCVYVQLAAKDIVDNYYLISEMEEMAALVVQELHIVDEQAKRKDAVPDTTLAENEWLSCLWPRRRHSRLD